MHQEARINNGFLQAENQYFQISRMYIIIVLCRFSALFSFSTWRDDHFLFQCSKGKGVPLQTRSGPEGSRKLRFPDFVTTAQDGGKVVSLTHRPLLSSGNTPGTYFC